MSYLKKNDILIIVFLIFLLLPSIWFLIKPGLFVSDDASWMVIRFSAFYEALRDGQFPVRFLTRLNFGYGYPVSNFLYPGFMYLATPFHVLGFNFQETIKIIFGFSLIFSGVFSYLWLSKLFSKVPSFFAALFYVYAPYHLFDLYKRGSIGEMLALSIVPFIFWQTERKSIFFTALGIFLLLISHNTLAAIFLPIIILNFLIDVYTSKERKKLISIHGTSLVLGVMMSAFFSLPAIFELRYTIFSKTKISNFHEYFSDINLIGFTTLVIFAVLAFIIFSKRIDFTKHRLTISYFLIGLVSLFFSTEISSLFWNVLPVSFIQFPFRLLSVTIVSAAFLLAFMLSRLSTERSIIVGIFFILVTIFFSKDYLAPIGYTNFADSFYSTNEATTTVMDEYMPKWVKEKPTSHPTQLISAISPKTLFTNVFYNSKVIMFNYSSNELSKITVNRIYYPGWRVKINGVEKKIDYENNFGIMMIEAPKGKGSIVIEFVETNIRLIANFISLLSIVFLIMIALKPGVILKK